MNNSLVQYGIDVLLQQPHKFLQQRIALVTNNAATTINGELTRAALLKNKFHLVKLFSPEHGINTRGTDGAAQSNTTDAITGLPVISLYNNKLAPTEEELHNTDVVLFDIPDVGCRFYTYLWTMTHVMEACAQFNKPFVVLDRPNPIGALIEKAEGPFLDEIHCSSFIGRWNIPLKHSCTLGELALYFAATRLPNLNIQIIKASNYHRHQTALHHFPFVPTSPAIQTIQTAILYPGTGLLEGVNINEARGTQHPFTSLGAPWINAHHLCTALQHLQLQGLNVTLFSFKAAAPPYENEMCNGVQLHITNPQQLNAVHTGISIVQTIAALYPQQLQQRLYKTNANPSGTNHLDKLLGIPNAFEKIQTKQPIPTAVEEWQQIIEPYLLYTKEKH